MHTFVSVKDVLPVRNLIRAVIHVPKTNHVCFFSKPRAICIQSNSNAYIAACFPLKGSIQHGAKLQFRDFSSLSTRQFVSRSSPDRLDIQVAESNDIVPFQGASSEGPDKEVESEEGGRGAGVLTQEERASVQNAWDKLIRWSRIKLRREEGTMDSIRAAAEKVVVLGGGSFGTAMASILARNDPSTEIVLLVRDENLAKSINENHKNSRYFPEHTLPDNVTASTNAEEALDEVQYIVHAIPVQASSNFLASIAHLVPSSAPIICLSKGLEVGTGRMMAEMVYATLGKTHPLVVLSGPSFAVELMQEKPTMLVAASSDLQLAQSVSALFSSPNLRVNLSDDVVGVEVAGALKNVLAIAAGIVEGLNLGNNAIAALTAQGCTEIRQLSEKMGAKPATLSGPAGVGDIMLTCFVPLSRNRTVGVRLGAGESLEEILKSGRTAEGVATAGVVISLAKKYNVSLPVLTAVSRILDNQTSPRTAVMELMNMPQIPEN